MSSPSQTIIPDDIDALKAALFAARIHAADVESKFAILNGERDEAITRLSSVSHELATERAQRSDDQALIAHMKLVIAKMKREKFGPRSEKSQRLLDQMEFQLEELEASATEDELAAELGDSQVAGAILILSDRDRALIKVPYIRKMVQGMIEDGSEGELIEAGTPEPPISPTCYDLPADIAFDRPLEERRAAVARSREMEAAARIERAKADKLKRDEAAAEKARREEAAEIAG